jgi:hypothetical protein
MMMQIGKTLLERIGFRVSLAAIGADYERFIGHFGSPVAIQ